MHKPPDRLAIELKAYFANIGCLNSTQIAEKSGFPQYAVWRALFGKPPRRLSKTLKGLCDYAEISMQKMEADPTQSETLVQGLRKIWDGSDEHAQQIVALLFAGHNCRVRK